MRTPQLHAVAPAAPRADRTAHPRANDTVFASHRRMILGISVPAVMIVMASSFVFAHTRGPEAAWLVAWWVLDLLAGGGGAPRRISRAARIPLLTAVVVTGVIGAMATLTPSLSAVLLGTEGHLVLLTLWATALVTAGFRALIPLLLPLRCLRVVAGPAEHGARVSDLVFAADRDADPDAFVDAVLAEVERHDIELVELTFGLDSEGIRELSWKLRNRDVELYLPLFDLGLDPGRVCAMSATHSSGLLIAPSRPGPFVRAAKRIFDVVLATVLILVLSPVLAGVAIAIKISMPGPVLFRQERIGLDGRPFRIIKFRSMIVDADAQLTDLLTVQGTASRPLFKVDSDPRITRLGHLLRRSSLDELPQLFNVIGGSMSLVGPRPQRDGEVALYTGSDHHRLGVRPGMTGLWQVSGRSDLGWEQAREFDLYYAHNWNLKNDLVILVRTFGAVVRAAGAR